ncbi:hypothetical protein C8J57DRAFT_1518041 [Mycena rebaudengoi]|nr:hypothetical protein C8J57DRAFT_1518041 [Mycena rebaudengoi]
MPTIISPQRLCFNWLGMGFFRWMGGVLPALLRSFAFITPAILFFCHPALRVRTLRTLQAYMLFAFSVLVLHATLDASTPLFVRSRKHPWTPHPALLILVGTQTVTVLAALYALRDVFVTPFRVPPGAPRAGSPPRTGSSSRAPPTRAPRPRAQVVVFFPPPPPA